MSLILLSLVGSISAYSIYVDAQADPQTADGSFEHPYTQVQQAINHAFNDNLTINLSGPPVDIVIQDFPGGYVENLVLDYSPLGQPHLVNDVTIKSNSDDPVDCIILANTPSSPVVTVKGEVNSKFKLKGVTIKHMTIPNGVISIGVSFFDPSFINHYFNDIVIDNCKFSNNLVAVEFSISNWIYLDSFQVTNSIFDLTHNSSFQARGIDTRTVVSAENAVIRDNVFDRFVPILSKSEAVFIGRGFVNIDIVNNDFSHAIIANANNYHAQSYLITNNRFDNSGLAMSTYGSYVIEDNRFSGLSSNSDLPAIRIERGSPIQTTVCSIQSNQFWGCHSPIEILIGNTESLFGPINTSVINNSFIDCAGILSLQRYSNLEYSPNLITDYLNNLYDGPSHNPFTITDQSHNPLILTGNNRIPISHSHFRESLTNVESLNLDAATISYGEPYLDRDEINFNYALKWDEDIRSPLILAGSGTPGFDSQDHADNYDIGLEQYDENSHENVTYTFPPYSVRNGLKWMSFPTIDRIWNPATNDPDVASTFFSPILDYNVLDKIAWKYQEYDPQAILYNGIYWVGDLSHTIIPQQGYKMQMAQGLIDPEYISVPGLIPAIGDFPLVIKAQAANKADEIGNENWLGYFYPETTQAREAFEGVIDYLWFIQTQNWTMCREDKIPGSPWIYALQNGKEPTLSYGDMVIVKCFEDRQFIWNTEAMNQIAMEKELPSHFVYEEKPDYVPVYIELDGTDLPTELALYVDDVCKGAVVVTDSLVEIPAYVVNNVNPNAEVQIRAFYEGKSTTDFIPEYRVWDQNSGAFLDTRLSLKSKNYYYKVKLVQSEQDAPPLAEPELKIYPNPFNPSTTIRFKLSSSINVKLEIYNQRGQLVRRLVNEKVQAGEHSISWDGKDDAHLSVSSGLYYAKLSYQNKSTSKKMVLIK